MLKEHMKRLNYDNEFIDSCCEAIENHKWNMKPKTKEGLIVKDADKLAFIGIERWNYCLDNNQKLDEIIALLPQLRNNILFFEESKKIYDREIINIVKLLYDKYYN
jgi:HD superfamily phosphodiesterase